MFSIACNSFQNLYHVTAYYITNYVNTGPQSDKNMKSMVFVGRYSHAYIFETCFKWRQVIISLKKKKCMPLPDSALGGKERLF